MRRPASSKRPQRQQVARSLARAAPVKGWNVRDPEADMDPQFARVLDNWFPTTSGVTLRKGCENHATAPGKIRSLHVWSSVTGADKLFAFTDAGTFDVTATAPSTVNAQPLLSGYVEAVNFRTSGGSFLVCVNGIDTLKYYNGTSWNAQATLTLPNNGTLSTAELSNVAVFKRRLFFIGKASMNFYYYEVDSFQGNAGVFALGGLFNKGGYLVAMGTWSLDGGVGIDDYCAFVTSKGQIAIYAGSNPGSSTDWSLVGVFDLTPPLGKKCFVKFGADLLYLSNTGVYPLSKSLVSIKGRNVTAVSDNISGAFANAGTLYGTNPGWQAILSPIDSFLLVNVPVASDVSHQYVMNTITGAWTRFLGWNAGCFAVLGNRIFMGVSTRIVEAWTGFSDYGGNITSIAANAFDYFGSRASTKQFALIRPALRINGNVSVDVALDVDFRTNTQFGPQVFNPLGGDVWDQTFWNTAMWSTGVATRQDWVTTAAYPGYCASVRLRVAGKNATVEWSATDIAYEGGGLL